MIFGINSGPEAMNHESFGKILLQRAPIQAFDPHSQRVRYTSEVDSLPFGR